MKKKCSPRWRLLDALCHQVEEAGTTWNQDWEREVPKKWEKHGDLVLLPSSAFRSPVWGTLGAALWQRVATTLGCQRLARMSAILNDEYRSPQVEMLLGENTWVTHVDNGIKYSFDVARSMFSSGNISEKLRVAGWDCHGETVVDLYAGIGYFTLPYLVHAGASHVYACEWNPAALEALRSNVQDNGVSQRCTILPGDNAKTCPHGVADRVNLGLIPSSEAGWLPACRALKSHTGGMLHIHANVTSGLAAGNKGESSRSRSEVKEQVEGQVDVMGGENVQDGIECEKDYSRLKVVSGDGCDLDLDMDNVRINNRNKPGSYCENDPLLQSVSERSEVKSMCSCDLDQRTDGAKSSGEIVHEETETESFYPKENHKVSEDTDVIPGVGIIPEDVYDKTSISASASCAKNSKHKMKKDKSGKFKKKVKSRPDWTTWAQETAVRIRRMLEEVHCGRWTTQVVHIEHVKSYAPRVDHLVLDLLCGPQG